MDEADEPGFRYTAKVLAFSYAVALSVGWSAGEILKALGLTGRIESTVVGGGVETTIYPVAGEWYGGMVGVVVLVACIGYTFFVHPRVEVMAHVTG